MERIEELRGLLEKLPRSERGFVTHILIHARNKRIEQPLIDFVRANPCAYPSDVLEYYRNNFKSPGELDYILRDGYWNDPVDEDEEKLLKELKALLENVPRTYWDFIYAMLDVAEDQGIARELIDFIRANPEANSSDVIKYYTKNFMIYDEEEDECEDAYEDEEEITDEMDDDEV